MVPLKFKSKAELLAAIEALRPRAREHDAAAKIKHAKDEKAYLKAWKAAVREALKWDYATAKRHGFKISVTDPGVGEDYFGVRHAPACPTMREHRVDEALSIVGHMAEFTRPIEVHQLSSKYRRLWGVLTMNTPEKPEVCQ